MPSITGTLAIHEAPDRLAIPSVPKAQIGIANTYLKGVLPILSGGAAKFGQKQFDQLDKTIAHLLIMNPQSATAAPQQLFDGMRRLSRAPWRPVTGQIADAWVYFDAASGLWRLLSTAPSNTA